MKVLFLFFAFVSLKVGNPVWSKVRYVFLGLMIINGIITVISKYSSKETRLFSLMGIILLVIAPLGSDTGLDKLLWGTWLLGPLILQRLKQGASLQHGKGKFSFQGSNEVYKIVTSILFIAFLTYAWNNTYNDPGSRLKKRYTVNHPKLKCIYTTQERAEVANEMLNEIQKYVESGDTLLAFIELPMVHYLSG